MGEGAGEGVGEGEWEGTGEGEGVGKGGEGAQESPHFGSDPQQEGRGQ